MRVLKKQLKTRIQSNFLTFKEGLHAKCIVFDLHLEAANNYCMQLATWLEIL
jgi:hypothetical protein